MARTRSTALAALLTLVTAIPTAPAAAQGARKDGVGLMLPISGTEAGGGTVAGTLFVKEFVRNGDGIDAIGTLTATITSASSL
jgi:hypothetical protein